jgi:hypothetical protein
MVVVTIPLSVIAADWVPEDTTAPFTLTVAVGSFAVGVTLSEVVPGLTEVV